MSQGDGLPTDLGRAIETLSKCAWALLLFLMMFRNVTTYREKGAFLFLILLPGSLLLLAISILQICCKIADVRCLSAELSPFGGVPSFIAVAWFSGKPL